MKNLNGRKLKLCSKKPLTGFTRHGFCRYHSGDYGNHTVCVKINKKFLDYTKKMGNNLDHVVNPGDNWCICRQRYLEALKAGKAPQIIKNATPKINKDLLGGTRQYLLPKLRKITRKNKRHQYRLYDPPYKRHLAIDEGVNSNNKSQRKNAAKMKKARFNVLRLYRKNRDKKGCNNLTQDMRYIDRKWKLGTTKNICNKLKK